MLEYDQSPTGKYSGYCEYFVTPYGLVTTPSVFQAFINDILRDTLSKFVIIYINDVLKYLDNLKQYIDHVNKGAAECHAIYCLHQSKKFHWLYMCFVDFIYHM